VTYPDPRRVEVTGDDRAQIYRLNEEISSRLEEMAQIAMRAVGIPLTDDMIRTYVPRVDVPRTKPGEAADFVPGPDTTIEIVQLPVVGPPVFGCVFFEHGAVWVAVPCDAKAVPTTP
jgi:hypothetical protein